MDKTTFLISSKIKDFSKSEFNILQDDENNDNEIQSQKYPEN